MARNPPLSMVKEIVVEGSYSMVPEAVVLAYVFQADEDHPQCSYY